jgi:phosphatidate phosphatase APP1
MLADSYAEGRTMTDDLKPLPDQEPLRSDWFIEQLGNSQQKVMSLTVQVRELKKQYKAAQERAEILEELVFDIVLDMRDGVDKTEIHERIRKVMQKLDGEDQ